MVEILGIGTATPRFGMQQSELTSLMIDALKLNSKQSALCQKVGLNSAINQRYSVLEDFTHNIKKPKTFLGPDFPFAQPNLHQRNLHYQEEAPKLGLAAAHEAIKQWGQDPKIITHIVVISCTGVMIPGLDVVLVDELALNSDVERYGIHFMGCFGAIKGLAAATAFCQENHKNCVLVLCVELCSLHFQATEFQDTLLSNLLFADGAAAVIMGSVTDRKSICKILKRKSILLPASRDKMSWDIGKNAFEMHMSKEVPGLIRQHIKSFIQMILGNDDMQAVDFVIHPGGKAILHNVERACNLSKQQTRSSWEILKTYGNMSSPTVLFILKHLLEQGGTGEKIIMLAFGPGLTVEGMLCHRGETHVA